MSCQWSDIAAVKNVTDASADGLVYLGNRAGTSGGFPGIWTSRLNAARPEAASWTHGGVGDLLAVAVTNDAPSVHALHGRVIALCQSKRYTHLGVVRSSAVVPAQEANGHYDRFVWVEVLAMSAHGVVLNDSSDHAWFMAGGNFIGIDNVASLDAAGASALRKQLWREFGMDCPSDVQRPARRP